MNNKFILTLIYLIFFFNSNILSEENKKILKVGLLAPLTGQYSGLGNSILYSLQLALEELGDKNVFIFPKDSGFNNKEKLNKAIQGIKSEGIKIVIGPIEHKDFNDVKKYNDLIFISPSNIDPNFNENIISIGVSLESQLTALINFIEKQKKKKTVIMYPKNQYSEFIEKKNKKIKFEQNKNIYVRFKSRNTNWRNRNFN
jgi:ABC-type branched-subunit amino acid transport system substrate-binding protein